jgi:hypothetical protein
MKTLKTRRARQMSKMRRKHAGGRPPVPTRCWRCQTLCPSRALSLVHCARERMPDIIAGLMRQEEKKA